MAIKPVPKINIPGQLCQYTEPRCRRLQKLEPEFMMGEPCEPLMPLKRLRSILSPTRAAVLLIASIGIFHTATVRSGHVWGDDFSMYIHHAKNIAEGRPYAQTGYLYNPANPIAPPAYPPMFPLLLAPIYGWCGIDLTAMKLELIGLFLLSLFMIYLALREASAAPMAVAVMAVVGFNPFFWDFKDEILSDIPFLLFTYTTCWLIMRADRPGTASTRQHLDALLAGVTALLAYETRTVGFVLIAAVVIADVIRFKRLTLRTALFMLPVAAFHLLQPASVAGGSGYLYELRRSFNLPTALVNADFYSREIRDLWRNGYTRGPMRAMFLTMNGLAIVGYVARLRRGVTFFETFSCVYGAVMVLWPNYQGVRLFIPLFPLYVFYASAGLDWLTGFRQRPWRRPMLAILCAGIAVSYLGRYTTLDYGPIREGVERNETKELLTYLRRETSPNAVYIFFKPRLLALLTGRRSSIYHAASDEELFKYFAQIGVTEVILNRHNVQDQAVLRPLLERHQDRFQPIFSNGQFTVYRLTRQPVNPTDSAGSA